MSLPEGVTNDDVEQALKRGRTYARIHARKSQTLLEVANDAVVDAVMWSLKVYDPSRGKPFGPLAAQAVRRFVWRAIQASALKHHNRPKIDQLGDNDVFLPSSRPLGVGDDGLSLEVSDLPEELRESVRLFYVEGHTMRECGRILGCSMDTIRSRLKRAALMLADDHTCHRPRKAGNRRLLR